MTALCAGYFESVWNYMDITNLSMFSVVVGLRAYWLYDTTTLNFAPDSSEYINYSFNSWPVARGGNHTYRT